MFCLVYFWILTVLGISRTEQLCIYYLFVAKHNSVIELILINHHHILCDDGFNLQSTFQAGILFLPDC